MNGFFDGLSARFNALREKSGLGRVAFGIVSGSVAVFVLAALIFVLAGGAAGGASGGTGGGSGFGARKVRILGAAVKDQNLLTRMTHSLDSGNIDYELRDGNTLYARDQSAALRARSILIRDDLLPTGTDPWAVFDMERWTTTDFERNVNLRRAVTAAVKRHIESIEDIERADVAIVMPEKELFSEDQNPVTASVILQTRPGSDFAGNPARIAGVRRILCFAVEGLSADNVVITDSDGVILDDGAGAGSLGHLEKTAVQQKIVREMESHYRAQVLKTLQQIYTADRVRDLAVRIEMDMSRKTVRTEEYFPFAARPDNPATSANEALYAPSVTRSSTKPAGSSGKTPQAASGNNQGASAGILSSVEEINKRSTDEEIMPVIGRISVSVNIDGMWKTSYDMKGRPLVNPRGSIEREYTPIPAAELAQAGELVRDAVGYSSSRKDSVTVRNIPFDRTAQFRSEDAAYFGRMNTENLYLTGFIAAGGLAAALSLLLVYFWVRSRSANRRTVSGRAGVEGAGATPALTGAAASADSDTDASAGAEYPERRRTGLQEEAAELARKDPEEVARLIRSWISGDARS